MTHGQAADSFWLIVRNGAETAAAGNRIVTWNIVPLEKFDLAAMAQLIDAAVASKPDGLIVSIPDAAVLSRSIQAAVAAKIPVISINSGLEVSKQLGCLMHIGQQDESAGKKAGERMKASGVKNAVILNQEVGNAALDQRIKGFREGFRRSVPSCPGPSGHDGFQRVSGCGDRLYLKKYPSSGWISRAWARLSPNRPCKHSIRPRK